jgi:DNA-binding transcriptional ArsR family regulator
MLIPETRAAMSAANVQAAIAAEDTTACLPADAPAADVSRMLDNARDASDYLKALAHEHRLVVLCLLSERERSVSELEQILGLRQPAVSQQLARLRLDGLVNSRRDGKTVFYSLADDKTRAFIRLLYDSFCKL